MLGIQTLNTLWDLLDSGFGWPSPRHGLNLLYWFANECVEVDNWNQITVLCDPSSRDFGFRLYHNNEGLLPVTNQPYFEVGNLNHEEARNLPDYVRREYNGYQYNNNADRIIICVDHDSVNRVYVTSHGGQRNFNPNQTFQISPQLLKTIRRMKREDFIRETTSVFSYICGSFKECCKMLLYFLFILFVLFVLIVLFHHHLSRKNY
ncbi:uncharacterized protein LOC103043743 [Astyanax mexicanus]|uniref:uncharacterized protein LOC103043743 n=1 Tax=Astyanax mexicanus TaxID=7994 RepID=UPI0020CB2B5B|nr:uncharacterized protein LOC103043743 [Astyanax mexicanus]